MKLDLLSPTKGSISKRKRVGRGHGSGLGKTSGRGHKGAGQRSGNKKRAWFEGGQMSLARRLPKRGFKPIKKKNIAIINLQDINYFLKNKKIDAKEEISIKNLSDKKLIAKKYGKLKILGKGEVKEKIKIKTDFISKSAKVKIEKIGGSINIVKEKTP